MIPIAAAGNGVLRISLCGLDWYVLPDGRSDRCVDYPQGVDPVTGVARFTPPRVFRPRLRGSPRAMAAGALNATAGALLSIVLIAAGAGTLVGARGAGRHHRL